MDLDHAACYRALLARDARFDGRFFVAVRTTGIFCRPICPARTPLPKNCIFLPTAAAAQQGGFRPCLRCRPESAPDLGAWRGSSATVSRALALIEAGGLDGADVGTLSGRLGMGARQLRRLFRQHLGAPPVAVAQTRRVLLARSLIHETDLPMTEVALASGFGSVRRFNEAFAHLYGRSPGALRRHRPANDQKGGERESASAITLLLPYRAPYDWPAMIGFLAARAIPGVEVAANGVYRRSIALGGATGTVEVAPAPHRDALRATIRFPLLRALPGIIGRLRGLFDLAADPVVIADALMSDPLLRPLLSARPGLRAPGAWDGFEVAVRAILGQQITVGAASRLAGKLAAAYGDPLPSCDAFGPTRVFPRPERLASADIAALGMPRARAAAITGLAARAASDPSLFLPAQSLRIAVERLRTLPGIGEWTAQYIAMRALRETDAFPAADIGLLRSLADAQGARPTPQRLLARAEAWRPFRAYAALHLWTGSSAIRCISRETDHAPDDRTPAVADRDDAARL